MKFELCSLKVTDTYYMFAIDWDDNEQNATSSNE